MTLESGDVAGGEAEGKSGLVMSSDTEEQLDYHKSIERNGVRKRQVKEELKEESLVPCNHSCTSFEKREETCFGVMVSEKDLTGNVTEQYMKTVEKGPVGDRETELPEDVYSLLFVAKPFGRTFFLVISVFLFQVAIMTLIMLDMLDYPEGFPLLNPAPGVSTIVRASQFFAIAVAVVTQDDVVLAINIGTNSALLSSAPASKGQCVFSCIIRFVEGALGLVISFLIIIQSDEVIDLLKDFAAMAFVSSLDDVAFFFAREGYFTMALRDQAEETMELKLPNPRKKSFLFRRVSLFLIYIGMTVGWICVALPQSRGDFLCPSISVQINDQFLIADSFHSGHYEWQGKDMAGRPVYVEREYPSDKKGWHGQFAFCNSIRSWTFAFAENGRGDAEPCDFTLRSTRTSEFNLVTVNPSDWFHETGTPATFLKFACDECASEVDCNFKGECNAITKRCECNSDRFGTWCEHSKPCPNLMTDVKKKFPLMAEEYEVLYTHDDEYLLLYGRPVYVHMFDERPYAEIIMFVGARWIASNSYLLGFEELTIDDLREYLSSFHADVNHWDAGFLSEPTDGVTPVGLQWYEWISGAGENSVGILEDIDVSLMCSVCDEKSNICGEWGYCYNSSCVCEKWGIGALCQAPTVRGTVALMFDNGGLSCSTCGKESYLLPLSNELWYYDEYNDTYIYDDTNINSWYFNNETDMWCDPMPSVPLQLGTNGTSRGIAFGLNETHVVLYHTDDERVLEEGEAQINPCNESKVLFSVRRDPGGDLTHIEEVVVLSAETISLNPEGGYGASCRSVVNIGIDHCATPEGFATYVNETREDLTRALIHIAVDVAGQTTTFQQ